jgi:hypothetical protein
MKQILKHKREFAQDLQDGAYELTGSGIVFPRKNVLISGEYFHAVNGEDLQVDKNLIVDQGILYILGAALGATAKITTWYLAPYATAISPAANWTAANFTATAGEITSTTEGFSQVTRPTWTPGTPATNMIDNLSAMADFSIVCTTSVIINGAGLLSSNTRGGTTGTLASAGRFATQRTVFNGDTFQLGYRVTLAGA